MAGRKRKSSPALGDDPLSWLKEDKGPGKSQRGNAAKEKKTKPAAPVSAPKERRAEVTIILDPVITLAETNDFRTKLLGHIDAAQIRIDAGKVEHIDTGGLQLLLAFLKTVEKQGGKINWLDRSKAFMNTVELLGLAAALGLEASL